MPPSRKIEIHPATADRWADLAALFGQRGACAGCWCMWPRLQAAEFKRGAGDSNRRALQRLVRVGERPGLLAYAGGEAVGWIALGPRADYPRLEKSRVLAPVDDQPVWSVTCFFIRRDWRGQGLATRLLKEAAKFAAANGARILEGYPTEASKRAADAFVWTGIASTFERAGFSEVARRSASRPIMRKTLRPRAKAPRRAAAAVKQPTAKPARKA